MELKTEIWDQMVNADRQAKYYGYLAGKLARKEKVASIATTTLSVVSAYSIANSWVWVAISVSTATVAASVFPLVFRYGGMISSASYCQVRLSLLSTKCKELWLMRNELDRNEVLERWRELELERSEITAFQSSKSLDRKLARTTEQETNDYWTKEAKRLSRIAEKGRAVQAGAKPATT